MTLPGSVPLKPILDDQTSKNDNSAERESYSDWMACAIPVENAAALAAAAAGIICEDDIRPKLDAESTGSMTASDASDISQVRDTDKDGRKCHDDCASEAPQTHANSSERMSGNHETGQTSPVAGTPLPSWNHASEGTGSSSSPLRRYVYLYY